MEYVYSVSIVCGLMKTKIFSQEIFNKERIPAGSRKEKNALHLSSVKDGPINTTSNFGQLCY